ncbi:MAG: hypothetical protein MK364_08870, partial [Pirellulales bacterium]|nr:hypothetical protein [Pirellulales bacterium]
MAIDNQHGDFSVGFEEVMARMACLVVEAMYCLCVNAVRLSDSLGAGWQRGWRVRSPRLRKG